MSSLLPLFWAISLGEGVTLGKADLRSRGYYPMEDMAVSHQQLILLGTRNGYTVSKKGIGAVHHSTQDSEQHPLYCSNLLTSYNEFVSCGNCCSRTLFGLVWREIYMRRL